MLDVAAHTAAHIAFVIPEREDVDLGPGVVLRRHAVSGGCGRLFEGTPADMHRALGRLAKLPESTQVCCAHEYTEGNLLWATQQAPEDAAIRQRYETVVTLRRRGELSLPSSIGEERRSNLFMRAESAEQLGRLRHHKDQWRAA